VSPEPVGTEDGQHPPWDPGLQNERTGLAWQRTLLSGMTCGLLVARLLAEAYPAIAIVVGVAAIAASASLGALAVQRFRRNARALPAGRPSEDGRPVALVTGLLVLTAAGALAYVLRG
jgi:uncharacterized membrane protein YidH (DUF202 family)